MNDGGEPRCAGELTYVLYNTVLRYAYRRGRGTLRYQDIADVLGALTCAHDEFYRRIAAPYEDTKRRENGDVRVDFDSEEG